MCASIIELVADFTAALETQRLLLDDFMHGFIYALVQQKWMQFTRYIFYTIRLFELGYLVALNVLCFLLKLEPCFRSIALAMGVLVVSLLLAALEIALMVLWWRKDVTLGFESLRGFRRKLRRLSLWARAFSWRGKMLGFACTSAACARYLATAEERMAGKHTSADDAPLYLLFGVSSYFQGKAFISSISVSPSLPNMGVQMFIIDKMFHNDVVRRSHDHRPFTRSTPSPQPLQLSPSLCIWPPSSPFPPATPPFPLLLWPCIVFVFLTLIDLRCADHLFDIPVRFHDKLLPCHVH